MTSSAPRTRGEAVLARLRSDILNGDLEPGSRLGFVGLNERYGVSTGVLREVLPRLVEQGLATSEPQLGFRVVTISVPELLELTEARVALETLVTRLALQRGDVEWETALVAAHHTLSRAPQTMSDGMNPAWIEAHEAFHECIWAGAKNRHLIAAATQLRTVSEVYRCWTRDVTNESDRDVAGEHRALMELAVSRDEPACLDLVEQHIRRTTDLLVATQLDPDLTATGAPVEL